MPNSPSNKLTLESEYQALYDATLAEFPATAVFEILGQTYTRDQFLSKIKARLDAFGTTAKKKADWRAAVEAEQTINGDVSSVRNAFRGILVMKFGKDSPKLLTFGYRPNKTPQKTSAAKTIGAVKAKATRKARGTMGKKQKKSVKGTVTMTAQQLEAAAAGSSASTAPAPVAPAPAAAPVVPAGRPSPANGS